MLNFPEKLSYYRFSVFLPYLCLSVIISTLGRLSLHTLFLMKWQIGGDLCTHVSLCVDVCDVLHPWRRDVEAINELCPSIPKYTCTFISRTPAYSCSYSSSCMFLQHCRALVNVHVKHQDGSKGASWEIQLHHAGGSGEEGLSPGPEPTSQWVNMCIPPPAAECLVAVRKWHWLQRSMWSALRNPVRIDSIAGRLVKGEHGDCRVG